MNQSTAQLSAISAAANPEQAFTDAGGKFLQPGASTSFSVRSGEQSISIVGVSPSGTSQGLLGQGTRTVARGATLNVNASSLVSGSGL